MLNMLEHHPVAVTLGFRIIERGILGLFIVICSIVLILTLRKTVQRIDFEHGSILESAQGRIVLATPIFILLAFIGYAYVSLSNPMEAEQADHLISTGDGVVISTKSVRGYEPSAGPGSLPPAAVSPADLQRTFTSLLELRDTSVAGYAQTQEALRLALDIACLDAYGPPASQDWRAGATSLGDVRTRVDQGWLAIKPQDDFCKSLVPTR